MKVNSDLKQRHLRDFALALKRRQPEEWDTFEELPISVYYDLFAQAANDAGWLDEEVTEEAIGDLTWAELVELVEALVQIREAAENIEKN